jgi:hypothetical protein
VAILIDEPQWRRSDDARFAHLVSDTSFEELHAFVSALTLALGRPLRFHRDHYDVPAASWQQAVDAGARVVPTREIVRRLLAAGLRATSARSARLRPGG